MDDETPGPSGRTMKSNHPSLLHEWKTTCLISKLPLELISYITALSLPETSPSRKRMKALYSTRMVSRTWRNAIDSTPSLWNVISSDLPLRVNSTIIQRSGCCSLDVYITARTSTTWNRVQESGFAELASKEIGRWSTACLKLPSPGACSSYLTSPAPRLRRLWITSRRQDTPTAPVVLFGGIAPRLEVLEVNGVQMDWTASFLRGLKELDLSYMIDEGISTQQVLEVLAMSPLLEKLRINNLNLGHRPRPLQAPHAIIQLPILKTIDLSDISEQAAGTILSSIRAPNCTALKAHCWEEDTRDGSDGFPGPALTHFADFLRRTLSANSGSELRFSDYALEWNSQSADPGGPGFELCIRFGATAIGVEWATRIIGLGAQEVVHDLEVTISRSELTQNEVAAYHPISRWQSVTTLTVEYGDPPPRPIFDLFGSCEDSEDGTGQIPAFPRLKTLVLVSSQALWLDDVEVLVNRRFGGREAVIDVQVPSLDVVLDMWGSSPKPRVDLAQLQRLRAAKGVRSIKLFSNKYFSGVVAIVYDDDTGT